MCTVFIHKTEILYRFKTNVTTIDTPPPSVHTLTQSYPSPVSLIFLMFSLLACSPTIVIKRAIRSLEKFKMRFRILYL